MSANLIQTDLEIRLYLALWRISQYQSVGSIRKYSQKDYGLCPEEALEYAYENVLSEAKAAIKGIRNQKQILKDTI